MAPQILHRVIHGHADPAPWQKALLKFQPAVLHGYQRHRVRGADYPGILAVSKDSKTQEQEADSKSTLKYSVLGTLVSGLTDGDLHRLDIYEGNEYAREIVKVRTLKEALSQENERSGPNDSKDVNANLHDVLEAAGAEFVDEGEEVDAITYVWIAGEHHLEKLEWDFETFKRDKMAWWINADESDW